LLKIKDIFRSDFTKPRPYLQKARLQGNKGSSNPLFSYTEEREKLIQSQQRKFVHRPQDSLPLYIGRKQTKKMNSPFDRPQKTVDTRHTANHSREVFTSQNSKRVPLRVLFKFMTFTSPVERVPPLAKELKKHLQKKEKFHLHLPCPTKKTFPNLCFDENKKKNRRAHVFNLGSSSHFKLPTKIDVLFHKDKSKHRKQIKYPSKRDVFQFLKLRGVLPHSTKKSYTSSKLSLSKV